MNDPIYQALIEDIDDEVALLSNTSAYLNSILPDLNWVGFYRLINDRLILGPFQGLVACVSIERSQGVCGHVATTLQPIIVDDVHTFEGHIACDVASNSEMVLPIFVHQEFYGVLDLDSPLYSRFTLEDLKLAQGIINLLEQQLNKIKNAR